MTEFTGPLADKLEAVYEAALQLDFAEDDITKAVRVCETAAVASALSPADFAAMLEEQVLQGSCDYEGDILRRIDNLAYREAAEELHYRDRPIPLAMYRAVRAQIAARTTGLAVGERRRRSWMRIVIETAEAFGVAPDEFAALFFGAALDGLADPEAALCDYHLPAKFEAAILTEIERRKRPREADVFNT